MTIDRMLTKYWLQPKGVNMNYTALWFSSTRKFTLDFIAMDPIRCKYEVRKNETLWWFCYLRHYFHYRGEKWSNEFCGYWVIPTILSYCKNSLLLSLSFFLTWKENLDNSNLKKSLWNRLNENAWICLKNHTFFTYAT